MQFWGAEVKSGEPLKVAPGDGMVLHLSQACLGEVKKGSEPGCLFVNFNDQKFALGTLSSEKFPQISLDLVFEKEFELSHTLKNGSVFFTGYRAENPEMDEEYIDDTDSEDDDVVPIGAPFSGRPEPLVSQPVKPDANSANQKTKNLKAEDPKKDDKANHLDTDTSEDESDESAEESDDEPMMNGGKESSDEDDDSDDDEDDDDDESEDEETPKKAEFTKKRPVESAKKTPVPEKKAKLVTPQKTDGKKGGGHIATPHPSKQVGKAAAANKDSGKQQPPKSAGDYSCKPCNRSFKTEDALQSHNKAKHSAK